MANNRFTEKEMAILYEHTEAPYLFDALVQGLNPDPNLHQKVHEIIGKQGPDVALLSLCLCGLVVARDLRLQLISSDKAGLLEDLKPLCAELEQHAHECLYSLGRLWLDTVVFELDVNPLAGLHILRDIPTNLQVMGSIFGELRDWCGAEEDPMRTALNILYYQAESHADRAEEFVLSMLEPTRERKVTAQHANVPLPLDLQTAILDHTEGAKVIPFSVFAAKSKAKAAEKAKP